jgi:hypothetical protein
LIAVHESAVAAAAFNPLLNISLRVAILDLPCVASQSRIKNERHMARGDSARHMPVFVFKRLKQ